MLEFQLTFAGVPFVSDRASVVRLPFPPSELEAGVNLPPRKHQPKSELIDELNRLIPFHYLQDFSLPNDLPGRDISALARWQTIGPMPDPSVKINDWYYPCGAARWSVFRGLATSRMVEEMLATVGGVGWSPQPFVMKCSPVSPDNQANNVAAYTVTTNLHMLPARPLAEMGGSFDGLYLVTLVDERYWWQYSPVSPSLTGQSTWAGMLAELALALGVTINCSSISAAYVRPEVDSQLWVNLENAALLLDAVAMNVGRVAVRNFDGTYDLLTPAESQSLVQTNRNGVGVPVIARTAGGDIFESGNTYPAGRLEAARNLVVPSEVVVGFPKYVWSDNPVPHFVNPRTSPQRPSCWYEESFGELWNVTVPMASGGVVVSGLIGTSGYAHGVQSTAKALLTAETAPVPFNYSGLTSLAMQVARDFWADATQAALDECYPGTFQWQPEGFHDVIWTYSDRISTARTRVMRCQWNRAATEFQHATPPVSGTTTGVTRGVGGPSVAQTVRDSWSGSPTYGPPTAYLAAGMASGDGVATVLNPSYFPTQNRWRGTVDRETILFEGTSGGTGVGVVWRGIDGTEQVAHNSGAVLTQVVPDATYGVNLVTHGPGLFAFPNQWTSGGMQGVDVLSPVRQVRVLAGSGVQINGVTCWSGQVCDYDVRANASQNVARELVWLTDRNDRYLSSGCYFEGQLVGFSSTEGNTVTPAPVYLVDSALQGDVVIEGDTIFEGDVTFVDARVTFNIDARLTVFGPTFIYAPITINSQLTINLPPIFTAGMRGGPVWPGYFRQCSSDLESWYTSDVSFCAPTYDVNTTFGRLYFTPFCTPSDGTIDRIAVYVHTAGAMATAARLGIYQRVAFGGPGVADNRPWRLVLQTDEFLVDSTGLKSQTVDFTFAFGELYWLVVESDADVGFRSFSCGDLFPIFGTDTTLDGAAFTGCGFVERDYGLLPMLFPVDDIELLVPAAYTPVIGLRFECENGGDGGGGDDTCADAGEDVLDVVTEDDVTADDDVCGGATEMELNATESGAIP